MIWTHPMPPPPGPVCEQPRHGVGVGGGISIFMLISIWILIFIPLLIWIDNIGIPKLHLDVQQDFLFLDMPFSKRCVLVKQLSTSGQYLLIFVNIDQYTILRTVCIYTYIYVYVYTYIYTYTYIYIYVYLCICVYIYTFIYVYIHICRCAYNCLYDFAKKPTVVFAPSRHNKHVYIYIYIYVYTYI